MHQFREIDGSPLAEALYAEVADTVAALPARPGLAALIPEEDPIGALHGEQLSWDGEELGIGVVLRVLPVDAPAVDVAALLDELSANPGVHGVSVAEGFLAAEGLRERIDPAKDVEGVNPLSLGRLAHGLPAFSPVAPVAVMELLRHAEIPLAGARTVVVGEGIPLALQLRAAGASVTLVDGDAPALPAITAAADVLVSAVGKGGLITAEHVKQGATVVSVGLDHSGEGHGGEFGGLLPGAVGDAEAKDVAEVAGAFIGSLTVGALTPTLVLRHVAQAATDQLKQE
ncbi:bifunctional 5,10-methylenetetrahydrofolate dehydrogenase/5,10-methenyltetrahydrofolate cyclohydrolase [Allokutzneria albata]|uniref:Methylenetetrahydrofolate dehydrogenase (NADP+) / methenyltetrahydrofolate cyclohydrolase n=1 Tax=Allokutzneria albata TaxID=211114 RepID=A0A1G9VXA8_ALLAB|nr:bifunctional 5,10-methylenetetrahydrofolate dehydrogenase/5,10-methenyltetrahydrofolate cyclohydrolase [Allokutzneria albata]SDM76850.1 methylenetetrahydrofolate dehydrogenase (NADP+) / methenyltetrahydrofolate cyclohydrolase [Allokutzneria albata]